jgi:periplasmic mercuric ion binding protein
MKSIRFIISVIIAVLIGISANAQTKSPSHIASSQTQTIKVMGTCELCKARIEKAAKIDGVNKAEWNKETKVLTLVFNPAVVTSDEVQKKIAAAGHDTEKYKASDKAYSSLPSCCQYERKK